MSTTAAHEESPDISIVVPVYACASCIEPLLERTRAVVRQEGWRAEWVFVDDASPDDAWRILKEQASKDPRIGGLRLGQNRGQHFAIYAGLQNARGRFSVVMDGDLEDPPEEIPRLVTSALQGYDIVLATYSNRDHPGWRRAGSWLYFWLLGGASPKGARLSALSVLSERARSAYNAAPLAGRAYVLVLLRLDLPTAFISSRKESRHDGVSSYDLRKLSPLAVRNILIFNPWRLVGVLTTIAAGVLVIAVGLWGGWRTIPIWLSGVIAAGVALAALRWSMLARGGTAFHLCEKERLHE